MKKSFTKYLKANWMEEDFNQEHSSKSRNKNAKRIMRRRVKRTAERLFNKDHKEIFWFNGKRMAA